jgi:large subunit ribosomal protein L25
MKFTAFERTLQGTGASRRLRNAARCPASSTVPATPTMIELDHNALFFALKKEAFHSSILEMDWPARPRRCCCATSRCTPGSSIVLHVDFQRVDETTKLRKKVPLHFVGRRELAGRQDRQVPGQPRATELEIECLATAAARVRHHRPVGPDQEPVAARQRPEAARGIKAVKHGTPEPGDRGVTTQRARARQEEQRGQRAAARCNGPCSALTQAVNVAVSKIRCGAGDLHAEASGQLPFLGSVRLAPLRGRRRHLRSRSR